MLSAFENRTGPSDTFEFVVHHGVDGFEIPQPSDKMAFLDERGLWRMLRQMDGFDQRIGRFPKLEFVSCRTTDPQIAAIPKLAKLAREEGGYMGTIKGFDGRAELAPDCQIRKLGNDETPAPGSLVMNSDEAVGVSRVDGYVLIDPRWQPESEDEAPPAEHVVGIWPLEEDGGTGKFRTNPDYRPANEDSPSDPLDAVLRLLLRDKATIEDLRHILRDTLFDLAVTEDGRPLRTTSPDEIPCLVIASGEPHRTRVMMADWRRTDLDELVVQLEDGVDVLINPAGPAAIRLTGDFLRETLLTDDDSESGGNGSDEPKTTQEDT